MARGRSSDIRRELRKVIPESVVNGLARETGAVQRRRRVLIYRPLAHGSPPAGEPARVAYERIATHARGTGCSGGRTLVYSSRKSLPSRLGVFLDALAGWKSPLWTSE
jgi:hypothetical protein